MSLRKLPSLHGLSFLPPISTSSIRQHCQLDRFLKLRWLRLRKTCFPVFEMAASIEHSEDLHSSWEAFKRTPASLTVQLDRPTDTETDCRQRELRRKLNSGGKPAGLPQTLSTSLESQERSLQASSISKDFNGLSGMSSTACSKFVFQLRAHSLGRLTQQTSSPLSDPPTNNLE